MSTIVLLLYYLHHIGKSSNAIFFMGIFVVDKSNIRYFNKIDAMFYGKAKKRSANIRAEYFFEEQY